MSTAALAIAPLRLPRVTVARHLPLGIPCVLVWLHLMDAAVVHPQSNATFVEHLVQAFLAFTPLPAIAWISRDRSRLVRGALALTIGLPAFAAGLTIHIVGVIKNGEWLRSDFTGVPMAFAGLWLLIAGTVLVTLAIARRRYRLLMVPASFFALFYVIFPVTMATYVTHAPRYVIHAQDLGAPYEEVSFRTSDGVTLRGWYVPSKNGAAVAILHGSGGARIRPLEHARMLVRNGYGVLLFDARGHGESGGDTNALGWGGAEDATAAAAYLATRAGVEAGRIGLMGVSMGAEVGIQSAAEADGFAAIVADGASGRTASDAKDAPHNGLFLFGYTVEVTFDFATTLLSGDAPAPALTTLSPKVTQPVLYIGSGTDKAERGLVTKIAERSGGEHELWIIDDAGHTQGIRKHPAEYEARVMDFFGGHLLAVR